MSGPCRILTLAVAVLAAGVTGAAAQTADAPRLHLHQDYMEQVLRPTTLDVADPMAVFFFVLNTLPERVKIYPTENYFYFTFAHNGLDYAGNIRLDASDRERFRKRLKRGVGRQIVRDRDRERRRSTQEIERGAALHFGAA